MTRTQEQTLRRLVAQACHILYIEGHEDFHLGHASARAPDGNRIYVKPAGLGLQEVQPVDVAVMDLEGHQLAGRHPLHREMPIHTEIYRARPDVQAVIHTHPPYATAFSATGKEFIPLGQRAAAFFQGIQTYESPELITTRERGAALAQRLGQNSAVLLRSHGIAAVGRTVEEAVVAAISLEKSLRLQVLASLLGGPDALAPEAGKTWSAEAATGNTERIKAIWAYLVRKAERELSGHRGSRR
ncbi:MAG: class II aldolase/adducin family protein [Dehalococcoidia bacterium]